MTQANLQNIKSKLKLYILNNDDVNDTKLAELFLEENSDIKLSVRSVRRYISLVKNAEAELDNDINDLQVDGDITDDTRDDIHVMFEFVYNDTENASEVNKNDEEVPIEQEEKVIEDVITLGSGVKAITIKRQLIDRFLCAYSRHGLNLSSGEVQNLLALSPEQVNSIIYKLSITKESKPYSVHSESILTPNELYAELNDNIAYLLNALKKEDGLVTNKLQNIYKKSILLDQHKDLKFEALFDDIKQELTKLRLSPMQTIERRLDAESRHTHLFIPDMHIGLVQDNYDLDIIREKLSLILGTLAPYKNIHVHFMGDIIHSVSGLNHKDSWKNMHPSVIGAEAIIQPYKVLAEFLGSIESLYSVNIVGGNHDRLESSKDAENTGEGAKLIAFMLRETLKSIPVSFDSYRIVDNADPKMTIILLHGDKPIDKDSAQSIAWNYGDQSKFNYIMTAHTHSRKINPKDDGLTYRKETLPAFCPIDLYGQTVANSAVPAVKLVISSHDGLPITLDIPLKY